MPDKVSKQSEEVKLKSGNKHIFEVKTARTIAKTLGNIPHITRTRLISLANDNVWAENFEKKNKSEKNIKH